MINKIKIGLGVLLTLGLVFKPIQCTVTQSIVLAILAIVGAMLALDGLMKWEY